MLAKQVGQNFFIYHFLQFKPRFFIAITDKLIISPHRWEDDVLTVLLEVKDREGGKVER
jgi:hypothetical protein